MSHNRNGDFLLQQLPSLPRAGLLSCHLSSAPKGDGSAMAAVGRTGILGGFKAPRGDSNFGALSMLRFAVTFQRAANPCAGKQQHPGALMRGPCD